MSLLPLPRLSSVRAFVPLLALAAILPPMAQAQTHLWQGPFGGAWSDPANWSTGVVPNAANAMVSFTNSSGAGLDLALGLAGGPFTVGGIAAANTSPSTSVVLGALSDPSGQTLSLVNLTTPLIDVASGTLQIDASIDAGKGFIKKGPGRLIVGGPISGSVPTLREGELSLAGANTFTGGILYQPWANQSGDSLQLDSALNLIGPGALGATGQNLTIDLGQVVITNSTAHARIDLGNRTRQLNLNLQNGTNTSDSSTLIEFTNGELVSGGSVFDLRISPNNARSSLAVHLPATTTLTRNTLVIGPGVSAINSVTPSARVRIGTQASFNLSSLRLGEGATAGRLDALAPGSTLRLRGNDGSSSMNSLSMGNFFSSATAPLDASLDLADGVLDAKVTTLYLGGSVPGAPTTVRLRFGAGTLISSNIALGGGSSASPANFDYQIEQLGGTTQISNALYFYGGNATGNVTSRYTLRGGTLAVGNIITSGNFTGTLRPRIEWSGGSIQSLSTNQAGRISGSPAPSRPLEIDLSGTDSKTFQIDANRTLTIDNTVRVMAPTSDVLLTKSGAGYLSFGADTSLFLGSLRVEGGTFELNQHIRPFTVSAANLAWPSGTLSFELTPTNQSSDRFILSGSFTKAAASASRVLQLKSVPTTGTYTLATYASTDLTPADFTVSGVSTGTSAEFTVGPTALTVTLAADNPYSTWRRAKFASSANLGDAADLADPDADGRPNLLEYALGAEPLAADASAAPVLSLTPSVPQSLTLTFRRIADPALTYAVRAAADPAGPWDETIFSSTGAANTDGPVTVQDTVPLDGQAARRFLRLFVTR